MDVPILNTDRCTLRPFRASDLDDIYALQSDAEALRYWDSLPWQERARADTFLADTARMAAEGRGIRLVIEDSATGAFLGWITVNSFNAEFRSASLGY